MLGKYLSLALAAVGASAHMVNKDATLTQSGNTLTLSGVSSGQIIIIETNSGGGAGWNMVNPKVAMPGQTHVVTVGGPSGLVYSPDSVMAAVGDIVEFHFLAKNHSVTQSTFGTPCVNAHMFDTGFVPNPSGTDPPPAMRVQVNSTMPTWFYCRQKGHCGQGMVFSINPSAAKTQAMFKQMAIAQNGTAAAGASTPATSVSASAPSGTTAAAVASQSVATGTGSVSNGQCSCSCLCGAGSFGNINAQSMSGSFGGFGGMLSPAPGSS